MKFVNLTLLQTNCSMPTLQELQQLEISILVDMLATHTADYTRMLAEGASDEEYAKCNLAIRAIQTEIDIRKRTVANTSTTDPNIILPSENK